MINSLVLFLAAAVVSLLLTWPVIWLLRFFRIGQPVRSDIPPGHQAKAGTPTMGGIGFVITIIALSLILIDLDLKPVYLALILLILGYALIGLADDLIKVVGRRNLGLTFWQKIILQTLAAGAFAGYLAFSGHNLGVSGWLGKLGFAEPLFYQLLVIFFVVGFANATNLTDGLNGLLSGTAAIAFLCLAFLATRSGLNECSIYALICAGAVSAFLQFNFPRAQVFMGDIGSLALGAGLAGLAVIMHKELRLVIIGGVFVIEALSVIIQVTSYKLFKRRVFPMTPLHHSFELAGMKEPVVVTGFWVVGLVLGVVGLWI